MAEAGGAPACSLALGASAGGSRKRRGANGPAKAPWKEQGAVEGTRPEDAARGLSCSSNLRVIKTRGDSSLSQRQDVLMVDMQIFIQSEKGGAYMNGLVRW